MGIPTVSLFGMRLARMRAEQLVAHVFERLARGEGGWIITANLDHLRRYEAEAPIREMCDEADLCVADGMPLVWASRLRGEPLPGRIAGSDLVWSFAERAARDGRSLYLLGGDPGVGERAAERLRARWPALRIVGVSSPRVSETPGDAEIAAMRETLLAARPDLVYVAFGAPKQEWVIRALRNDLPAAWWIGVGISLSFIAGEVRRSPRWIQRIGLEWVHRLFQEPGRLARRYLVDGLPFALRLLLHALLRRG